jgi:hypothetical protein
MVCRDGKCVCIGDCALVGVSDIALVEDFDGAITALVFSDSEYLAKVACAMRQVGYDDQYNVMFVYSAVPLNFLTNTQTGWPILQTTQGIGRTNWNMSQQFCTQTGVLRQAVKMGDINRLPNNPDDRYTDIPFYALSGIEQMGHLVGHQWLASITFDKGDGQGRHCFIRGWEGSSEPQPGDVMCDGQTLNGYNWHWSYYFNSGSVMYGSMWEDLGNGKFKNNYKNPKFSQLDQYLMGLRRAGDVDPMFLVDNGDHSGSAALPSTLTQGAEIQGTRLEFTINDVIRAEGERIPAREPCHWKAITVLVWNQDYNYTPQMLEKLARYSNRFAEWYVWATDDRGSIDLTIDGRGDGTSNCPAPD